MTHRLIQFMPVDIALKSSSLALTAILLIGVSGCKQPEVTAYEIPKEDRSAATATPEPQTGMTVLPGMAESTGAFAAPAMSAPQHWQEQPLGELRRGSWKIEVADAADIDVSVLVFPGSVGGLEANINRWRQQIGIPTGPLDNPQELTIDGKEGVYVKLLADTPIAGHSQPLATLGWIVSHQGGTWFFKWTGPRQLVEQEEPHFRSFLDSVRFPDSSQ